MRAFLASLLPLALLLAGCAGPEPGFAQPPPVGPAPGPSPSPGSGPGPAPADWRQFPLNVTGTRHAWQERLITPESVLQLKPRWSAPLGGAMTGTPVVADGRVYIGTWEGKVHAFDARTGAALWEHRTQGQVDGTLAAVGDAVYAGDGKGWLHRLDARTGREVWRALLDETPASHLYSSPLVHDGVVYIGVASDQHSVFLYPEGPLTFQGSVVAVNATEGKVRWRWWVQEPGGEGKGGSVWGSPVLDPSSMTLFVGTGNAYTDPAGTNTDAIVALDARTGAERWVFQATANDVWTQRNPKNPDWDFGSSPVYWEGDGQRLVVAAQKSSMVWARDAATGKAVWQNGKAHSGSDTTGSPAVRDGVLFVGSQGDRNVRAIRLADGATLWERDLEAAIYSSPAALPGLVLVGTSDGFLAALDERTGEERWRGATGKGGVFGGVSVVDGMVFHGTVPRGFLGKEGWLMAWSLAG